MERLDHIGIAVRDLRAALETWRRVLGVSPGPIEEVPEEGVRLAFFRAGEVRVELLEPLSGESPVARFIERRGEGVHHVAFAVPDARAALERTKAAGIAAIDKEPRLRGKNRRIAFLHPKTLNGVLVELVEHLESRAD